MRRDQTILLALSVALSFAAIGASLWWLLVNEGPDPVITGGILALAFAQLTAVLARIAGARRALREARAPSRRENPAEEPAGEAFPEDEEPGDEEVDEAAGPARMVRRPPANDRNPFVEDDLELYLEPIVRLAEERTVYYRASLGLDGAEGGRFGPNMLRLKAAQENLSPVLDLALFRRAAPVIRHFNSRGRRIGVFCAISPQSLADGRFLSELVAFLRANPDIAGGLVAEISQPALAGLSAAGLEGLGYLAQLGATFSLSEVRTRGVELDLLSQLGFKFIDIDVQAIIRAHGRDVFGPDGAAARLADMAEEAGFSVIAANLERPEDLAAVVPFASLGRGRVFSPPRIVRHEITHSGSTAAAA